MCPKKLRNLRTQLLCILWNLCIQCALFHLKRGSQWQQAALQAYSNYSLICLARENSPAIKNCTIFLASSARRIKPAFKFIEFTVFLLIIRQIIDNFLMYIIIKRHFEKQKTPAQTGKTIVALLCG